MYRDEVLQKSELSETSEALNTVAHEFFQREFTKLRLEYYRIKESSPVKEAQTRAKRMWKSDQEFMDPDLLPPLFKSAVLLLSQNGDTTSLDVADQIFDSINENGRGIESSCELSPDYLIAILDKNLQDAKLFLDEVSSGNIIF